MHAPGGHVLVARRAASSEKEGRRKEREERKDEKYHLAPVLVAAGDVEAPYGWEWGGACEQMVHTPLTARAYLALLTALDARL